MSRSKAKHLLLSAIRAGKFGDSESAELIFDERKGQDQFASSIYFVKIIVQNPNVENSYNVMVKMQVESEFVREWMNTDAQFYNETLMYGDVLPFLGEGSDVQEIFPKCWYYTLATYDETSSEDALLLDDLSSRGFRLSRQRLFLDLDHAFLSLKQLGRFHAFSYAAKQRDLNKFMDKVNQLKEVQYDKEKRDEVNKYFTPRIERGILPLFEKKEYKEILENFVSAIDDPFVFMKSLVAPEEPIAVLCHGDFCRDNILYKYDNEIPVDVKFIDLSMSRYCSPAIDLSFFIFLNVPSALRRERWDELLAAYHDGLSSAIPGTRVPSLDVVKLEMRRKAAYAYVLCSFFTPEMMAEEKLEMEEFAMLSQDEIEEIGRTKGGQEATDRVVAVLEDLIVKRCM